MSQEDSRGESGSGWWLRWTARSLVAGRCDETGGLGVGMKRITFKSRGALKRLGSRFKSRWQEREEDSSWFVEKVFGSRKKVEGL